MNTKDYNHSYWLKNKEELSKKQKIKKQLWYKEHKLEVLEERKKYYIQNKEVVKARTKKYRNTHKEWKKDYDKKYSITHSGKLREYWKIFARKWRVRNPERVKEIHKRYVKNNHNQVLIWNGNRRARLRGAEGSFTFEEWLKLKMQFNYTCPKCGKKEPDTLLTHDHIIPLSLNGTNYIGNIQPLCRPCNSSKGIKTERYSYVN